MDVYFCSAVCSETVFAALDSAVFDDEIRVALKSKGRKVGASGVVDRVSAEIDGDRAAVLNVEASAGCKAVFVFVKTVCVEAFVLDRLDVVAKLDLEVLVCSACLRPSLCK